MKKRVLPVLLAGLMLLGFSGCQKANPTEILQNAMSKTQSLESVEYTVEASADMESGGMRIGFDVDMNLKAVNDKENPAMAYTVSTAFMGQDLNIDIIYKDGTLYSDSMGYKIKTTMDYDEFMAESSQIFELTEFNSEDIKDLVDLEMKMDGDNVIFFFTADEETAKSLLDSIMKAMDMQSDDGAQQEINLKSLSGEYTVNKDGYLIGQKIDLSCEVTQDDVTSSTDVSMNLSLVNPGQTVEITVEDPDSYQDASDSSIDSGLFDDAAGEEDFYVEGF